MWHGVTTRSVFRLCLNTIKMSEVLATIQCLGWNSNEVYTVKKMCLGYIVVLSNEFEEMVSV